MIEGPQITLSIVNNQIQAHVQHLIDTETTFLVYSYILIPRITPSAHTLQQLLQSHTLTWTPGRLEKHDDCYIRCIKDLTLKPL